MGTYTTNYQLYMPTVGEQGWGTLVNTNFTTIDTTMKSLSNRITAVENEVSGALSCTSVTASGKITGNGGIAGTTGTFSGAVTGKSFNGVIIKTGTINVSYDTSETIVLTCFPSGYVGHVILPLMPNVTYTGSIAFEAISQHTFFTDQENPSLSNKVLTFTNLHYLIMECASNSTKMYKLVFS